MIFSCHAESRPVLGHLLRRNRAVYQVLLVSCPGEEDNPETADDGTGWDISSAFFTATQRSAAAVGVEVRVVFTFKDADDIVQNVCPYNGDTNQYDIDYNLQGNRLTTICKVIVDVPKKLAIFF